MNKFTLKTDGSLLEVNETSVGYFNCLSSNPKTRELEFATDYSFRSLYSVEELFKILNEWRKFYGHYTYELTAGFLGELIRTILALNSLSQNNLC